jgi:hypothetical protein
LSGEQSEKQKEGNMEDKERLAIVLSHLIEHNQGHGEDYRRWIELARNAGMNDIAALIEDANGYVAQASEALKDALDLIKR